MSDLLIGIDIGTTTTKVGVYQSSGKLIAEASRANPLRRHGPDACDQNPNDFYQGAVEAISRCLIHPEVDSGMCGRSASPGKWPAYWALTSISTPALPMIPGW